MTFRLVTASAHDFAEARGPAGPAQTGVLFPGFCHKSHIGGAGSGAAGLARLARLARRSQVPPLWEEIDGRGLRASGPGLLSGGRHRGVFSQRVTMFFGFQLREPATRILKLSPYV